MDAQAMLGRFVEACNGLHVSVPAPTASILECSHVLEVQLPSRPGALRCTLPLPPLPLPQPVLPAAPWCLPSENTPLPIDYWQLYALYARMSILCSTQQRGFRQSRHCSSSVEWPASMPASACCSSRAMRQCASRCACMQAAHLCF